MRRLLLALAAGLPAGCLASAPVRAGEPLLLRIRPNDSGREDAGRASDEARAARARALREAMWARSDARARIAIASVCTGCMKPMPLAPVLPSGGHEATGIASKTRVTIVSGDPAPPASVPPATLLATAGEP